MQTAITAFFPSVATDSKTSQIKRLRAELLLSYKYRHFKYSVNNVPSDAHKRLWWFFMDATLPTSHQLNPETFRKIMTCRGLTLSEMKALNYMLWTTIDEKFFETLTPQTILSLVFSSEEMAMAAADM